MADRAKKTISDDFRVCRSAKTFLRYYFIIYNVEDSTNGDGVCVFVRGKKNYSDFQHL